MNLEILKLAKECGSDDCIPNEPDKDGNFYMHYVELETFYRRAQAQALRDLVRLIVWPSKEAYDASVPLILRMADDLGKQA